MTYAAPPVALPTPPVICNLSSAWSSFAWFSAAAGKAIAATQTNPAANEAQYYPFVVTQTATFRRGFWHNSTAPTNYGNACVGIYDEAGGRLATTGAVAAGTASVLQQAAFTADVTLTPGIYYMAISFSASGINSVFGTSGTVIARIAGLYRQAVGSHPLPATATYATWTSQVTPLFGIATTTFAI